MTLAARMGIILLMAVIASAPSRAQSRGDAEVIVGSYKLVWYESYDEKGTATRLPYNAGQIAFDGAGRMSVQLMAKDRPAMPNGQRSSDAERAAAYSSYQAYFGRYTIDAEKGTVTYHVESALAPSLVGSSLVRRYELSPDRKTLFLSVLDGDRIVGKLRWQRY